MKYIIFQRKIGSLTHEFPIIFPNDLVHERVSQAFTVMMRKTHKQEIQPIAAGEVNILPGSIFSCNGESTTLQLKSRGKYDQVIIEMNDYGGGFS